MADVGNIFQTRVPSGVLAANAGGVLGQPVHTHQALNQAISVATYNLLDTANISEGAKVASEIAQKVAQITGSASGPQGIPALQHPVINGIADLRHVTRRLVTGQEPV